MVEKLPCLGCAYALNGKDQPSLSRPCHFCVRNPVVYANRDGPYLYKSFQGGSEPPTLPCDCYITLDMSMVLIQMLFKKEIDEELKHDNSAKRKK